VTDCKDVNPRYGTLDDFRTLTAACHKRGIRVILDLVLNHCSDKHPWFAAGGAGSAADPANAHHDWFTWADTNPGWKGPWNQQVWHRAPGAASDGPWYYGIFSGRMPDLNFRNAAVSEEMLSVVDFWVGKGTEGAAALGADGYRLDAIRHLIEDGRVQENTPETHAWLRTMRTRLKQANPMAMSIGEVWTESKIASSYVGNELDMTFEFELASAIVEAARTGKAEKVAAAQERVLACYPPNQYGRFLTNHDQTRVLTQLKGDAGAMRSAAAMLLLGPGVPFIYYGEEIGMTGDKPDENLRTPMQWSGDPAAGFTTGTPWEAAHMDRASANAERESGEESSLLSWYRRLIRVRGKYAALSGGGFEPVESGNEGVYAFMRTGEKPVLVVINLTGAAVSEYALRVPAMGNGKWIAREVLHEGKMKTNPTGGKPVGTLGAHQAYVLEFGETDK
jgi:glycosidase